METTQIYTHLIKKGPLDVTSPVDRMYADEPAAPAPQAETDTWPLSWSRVHRAFRAHGYRRSTVRTARQVLHGLAAHCGVPPSCLTREIIDAYLHALARQRYSASWITMNISILRTVFDKLAGLELLAERRDPRRPRRLPEILGRRQAQAILQATADFREHLLVGLLYGCGLRLSEACALRWQDVDPDEATLSIPASGSALARQVPIPGASSHCSAKAIPASVPTIGCSPAAAPTPLSPGGPPNACCGAAAAGYSRRPCGTETPKQNSGFNDDTSSNSKAIATDTALVDYLRQT